MKIREISVLALLGMFALTSHADPGPAPLDHYNFMAKLKGDWVLSPKALQEGKATKHKLVAPIVGTDTVAMRFAVVGKGSTVQENLFPGNGKEMATMYHCDDVKKCQQVVAKHYCAKQNQPDLVFDKATDRSVTFKCNMNSPLCNSNAGHVHRISHELSKEGKHLKTTYTIYKDGKYKKDSIYHFDRKI